MALKCCQCEEIQMDVDEARELRRRETFAESHGRRFSRTLVASGFCPGCFIRMARLSFNLACADSGASPAMRIF